MERPMIVFLLLLGIGKAKAQDLKVEAEIRKLEQMEVQATLTKDSISLLKIWDEDFVVNAPHYRIETGGESTLDRPVLKMARTDFTRNVEKVTVNGNVAISMGSEQVFAAEGQPPVKRRYTNIWRKKKGSWKLVGRHANIICE